MKEKYDVPIASESEFVEYMLSQMAAFGLLCTQQQAKDFYVYYARMIETNKYLNLTGITDMKEVVVKHMIDSLSCYDPTIIKSGSPLSTSEPVLDFLAFPWPSMTEPCT